jgi:hypothetical protein
VSESTAYMTLPCGSAKKCSADFGLPVVMEHPDAGMLNSVEFAARAVGMVVYSFVRDSDLMGVARILDAAAIEILKEGADMEPRGPVCPGYWRAHRDR